MDGVGNAKPLPLRGDVGKPEITRDPIFLLQSRHWHWSVEGVPPEIEWSDNAESWIVRDEVDDDGGPPSINMTEIAERWSDHVVEDWHTESVWFTREEAERFGEATHYRYSCGHRVYCICAEGELATLLKAHSEHPTGLVKA